MTRTKNHKLNTNNMHTAVKIVNEIEISRYADLMHQSYIATVAEQIICS